jgi:asparagine synthase (glutamine-hydrolysing)
MCGISGIVTFGGQPVAAEDLRRMSSAIAHRGPDAAGYALLEGGKVGLGHVRLSILDLKTGDQPLYDASGSLCIAYNGEIYDHLMLRRELIDQGHRFRTTSDTEVILALYAQHEMRFVEKLNGEFAFLLWDQPRQRLIAVKDRMGIKPLFYRTSPEEVLFCSEAKGILALPRVRRSLSPEFLTGPIFAAFPKAFSAFSDIQCLKPGHLLVIDRQGPHEEEAYWQPSYSRRSISLAEAKEGIRERLTTAVRRRMVADVPVCMYLSGGLDSTLVCALMAQQSRNLKAFNIGFSGSVYDESDRARRIAQHFGVQFEALDCPMSSLAEQLSKTLFHIETFIPNPGSVGKQLLSSLVHAQGYKVALTGEGSDEIFAGYPYFKMEKLWRMMQHGGSEARHAQTLWRRFREIERRSEGLLWNRNNTWRTTPPLFGYPCFTQIRSEEYGALIPPELPDRRPSPARPAPREHVHHPELPLGAHHPDVRRSRGDGELRGRPPPVPRPRARGVRQQPSTRVHDGYRQSEGEVHSA